MDEAPRAQPWWRGWHGLSAAIAAGFGLLTAIAFTLASPGWDRLSLAFFLGPVWLALATAWGLVLWSRLAAGRVAWRRWLISPLIVALALASTVGGVALSHHAPGTTAWLQVEAHAEGTVVRVSGVTDLPEGSSVWLGARHGEIWQIGTGRQATVRDGAFAGVLRLDRWPRGTIEASASFTMDGTQPPEAIERFGEEGERLIGPGVAWDSDGPYLADSVELDLADGLPPDHPNALREPGVIFGSIVDEAGEDIEEATARCVPATGAPLTAHDYAFSGWGGFECTLQPGEYTVTARAPGYRPASVTVVVQAGGWVETTITLLPAE